MKTYLPFFIFYYGFEKRKDDIYSTTCFSVFLFFILQKKKRKICITDPISIFRFLFVD